MKVERTSKSDPFKILVDIQGKGQTQQLEVTPSALNYTIFLEGTMIAKVSRRLGVESWVKEEGTLLKNQVDLIGEAIESHYL